jgi:hypothetical protein
MSSTSHRAVATAPVTADRDVRRRVALALAAVGTGFVVFQLWGYLAWLTSDDFVFTRSPEPVPSAIRANVERAQWILVIGAVAWTAFLIVHTVRRKTLTWPLLLTLTWALVYWQDPLVNFADHDFSYNAQFVDRGDWMASLPLLPDPHAGLPQPLLLESLVFYCMLPTVAFLAYGVMRAARDRLGVRSALALGALGWLVTFLVETGFENSGIRQGVLAWVHVNESLAVNAGTPNQWPVYEGVLLGLVWAIPGMLMFFRGRHRFTALDPGIESFRPLASTAITILSLVGFLNLVFLAYNVALMLLAGDTTFAIPGWFS